VRARAGRENSSACSTCINCFLTHHRHIPSCGDETRSNEVNLQLAALIAPLTRAQKPHMTIVKHHFTISIMRIVCSSTCEERGSSPCDTAQLWFYIHRFSSHVKNTFYE
jgi:hypothetical protein